MNDELRGVSLRVRNYKCFGQEEQGFERIYPINVIIGRNNSGKSTLLDVVKYAVEPYPDFVGLGHRGQTPEVLLTQPLGERELLATFPKDTHGGTIAEANFWEYGKRWLGKPITYSLEAPSKEAGPVQRFVKVEPSFTHKNPGNHQTHLARVTPNYFKGKVFKRLLAERDILPEPDHGGNPPNLPTETGEGITKLCQYFVTSTQKPRELVEEALLESLNSVYSPDSTFKRILLQQRTDYRWEIYLDEPCKGRIPLSHTGSGFKTILSVLTFLYLVPNMESKSVKDYVFAFEEPENNLHPALQRRLLLYLRDFALKEGCIFFLTTHSNIVIDMFSRDSDAQIVHVTHDGDRASVKCVQTYVDNKAILDDLDVRASDLLQSNCVVWVEGPSDRIYFNRWIELWKDGTIKEGIHYQCMYYGGRLLAHIAAADPEQVGEKLIAVLRLNMNAIFIMDSDKEDHSDDIGDTKRRVAGEIDGMKGLSWVTAGREVENYIPAEAIADRYGKSGLKPLGAFEDIREYLELNIGKGEGSKFERTKPQFAARVAPFLKREQLAAQLDLSKYLDEVCSRIAYWNRLA